MGMIVDDTKALRLAARSNDPALAARLRQLAGGSDEVGLAAAIIRAELDAKRFDPNERRDRLGRWAAAGLPKAPRIDLRQSESEPLQFRGGFRVDRGGVVYANTSSTTRGRPNPNYETAIGTIEKRGRRWVAKSPGGIEFEDATQADAAKQLLNWAQARENAGIRRRLARQSA